MESQHTNSAKDHSPGGRTAGYFAGFRNPNDSPGGQIFGEGSVPRALLLYGTSVVPGATWLFNRDRDREGPVIAEIEIPN